MTAKSNKPISALRQRMLEDMAMRKLGPKTRKDYIRAVVKFTLYLKRSPDTASAEDLREYQLHLPNQRVSGGTINATISGLKFFFERTIDYDVGRVGASSDTSPRRYSSMRSRCHSHSRRSAPRPPASLMARRASSGPFHAP